jgi:hypothetical protein
MGDLGFTQESALQLNRALLYWTAWMLLRLACLAGLTVLVFVWRECFVSSVRQPALPHGMERPDLHSPPETSRPRFALLPLIRIALTTRRRAGPPPRRG